MPTSQRWTAAMVAQNNARIARDGGRAPARPLALAADFFPAIRRLADAEGWRGQYTYNALGPDEGLHLILVRETVLYAYLLDEGAVLRPTQQRWKEALEQAGQEVHVWYPADVPAITARLTQPRRPQTETPSMPPVRCWD